MLVSAGRVFKELDQGIWKPLNLVVGDEVFQRREILTNFRAKLLGEGEAEFQYEVFDGSETSADRILEALQQLPGLFAEGGSPRLIVCTDVDRVGDAGFKALADYLEAPAETTCFVATVGNAKKKNRWYSAFDASGYVIQIREPYAREWPKWRGYFEQKIGKAIDPQAWDALVEASGRSLSLLWAELEKLRAFVGEEKRIDLAAVEIAGSGRGVEDVFAFGEAVLAGDRAETARRYFDLLRSGESDMKMLAILVKQYRLLYQCLLEKRQGKLDINETAKRVGAHPYFLTKLLGSKAASDLPRVKRAIAQLAIADAAMKRGRGQLFENFCLSFD